MMLGFVKKGDYHFNQILSKMKMPIWEVWTIDGIKCTETYISLNSAINDWCGDLK